MALDTKITMNNQGHFVGILTRVSPIGKDTDLVNVAMTTYNAFTKKQDTHFLVAGGKQAQTLLDAKLQDTVRIDYKLTSHKNSDNHYVTQLNVCKVDVIG